MARVCLALCLLFFLFTSTLCLDVNQIQVPTNDGISGVLLVQTKNYMYSFNATTAKEACEAIQMRIAKKSELETANKNGFQTCRFGWVEEKIAVIPRVEKHEKCGKNTVGVSVWEADLSRKFDVYCFKPAGPNESFQTTSSRPQPTTRGRTSSNIYYSTTTHPPTTGGRTSSNIYYSTTTTHPSTIKSASSPAYTSTPSISFTFNTSSTTFITLSLSNIIDSSQATTSPESLSSPRTSPKVSTSLPLSSSHSSTHFLLQNSSSSTGQPALSQTTTPKRPAIRAAPKTLIICSVMLLFTLAAAGAAWYLKIKRGQRFPSWTTMRPKQIPETEMWKRISERHWASEQTNKVNIILQVEQDPDSP